MRASTPLRRLSPTPLDRHRSRDSLAAPSPAVKLRLGSGSVTPGGAPPPDPHTFLSRPASTTSLNTLHAPAQNFDTFRAAMEAVQAEGEAAPAPSPAPFSQSLRDLRLGGAGMASPGLHRTRHDSSDMFSMERPSSAMSEMSINIPDTEWLDSRMEQVRHPITYCSSQLLCHISGYVSSLCAV